MQFIDLSKPIRYNPGDPFFMKVKIKRKPHKRSKLLVRALGLPFSLFPKQFKGWADDNIRKMGVHSTTHVDAPWHYGPSCMGKKAKTIDEVPLDWCYGKGIKIDMTHKEDFDPISKKNIQQFLVQNQLELAPGNIVLIHTGRDKLMGSKEFFYRGTGMSAEATTWLIQQGIKLMGIDQWGWDLPLPYLIKKAKKTKNPDLFWEAHLVGLHHEYCHMEQLTNLGSLPTSGFEVAAFPLRIEGGSAAPVRVVGIIRD